MNHLLVVGYSRAKSPIGISSHTHRKVGFLCACPVVPTVFHHRGLAKVFIAIIERVSVGMVDARSRPPAVLVEEQEAPTLMRMAVDLYNPVNLSAPSGSWSAGFAAQLLGMLLWRVSPKQAPSLYINDKKGV